MLQDNGRVPFAEIGKAIGLSPTSVAERVRRLESIGVVQGYRAQISASKMGFPLIAFILARPIGSDARFAKLAVGRTEILECYRVTGDVSFIARAAVRDVANLEEVLNYLEPSTSYIVTLVVLSSAINRPISISSTP
jgi:Lrp/AsnC family leucine-responsive transcriptional regulator